MFSFKPAVYRSPTLYELPRPIVALRVHDAWDFAQFKVPLADGDSLSGHSRQAAEITIEGQIGTQAGTLKPTEETMFDEIEQLRSVLHVDESAPPYDFYLYYDLATGTYRRFTDCSTVRFEADLSDPHLFTYSVVIHAADPKLYNTAA
jgi:hypothetical protein